AAYRDEDGQVSLCSPVCTYLKCILAWNPAEKTWDCPCHGSRFTTKGKVIAGPAEVELEKIPADAVKKGYHPHCAVRTYNRQQDWRRSRHSTFHLCLSNDHER